MSLLLIVLLAAPKGIVTGWVYDAADSRPVAGANVAVVGSALGAGTDEHGMFTIRDVAGGRVRLCISHVAYRSASALLARGDSCRRLSIGLRRQTIALAPVLVRPGGRAKSGPCVSELAGAEVRGLPGAEKDVFRAVQSLPGVSSTGDYFGWLYVRGGAPEENLCLLDGLEIPNPYHFSGLASVFATDLVRSVRFSTGGFGPDIGDRVSSVLLVETRGASRPAAGTAALDVSELAVSFECLTRPGFGLVAACRRSYLDAVLRRLDLGSSYVLPRYTDFQGRAAWRLGRRFGAGATFLSSSEAATAGDSGHWRRPGLSLSGRVRTAGLSLDWQPSGRARLAGTLSYLDSRSRLEVTDALGCHARDNHPRKLTLRTSAEVTFGSGLALVAGASGSGLDYRHSSTLPAELIDPHRWDDTLLADTGCAQGGAYASLETRLGPGLQVTAGGRLDCSSLQRRPLASPRLAASLEPLPGTRLRAAFGSYRQFVAPELLNPSGSQPNPLGSRQVVLGFEQELGRYSVRVEAYDKAITNVVVVQSGRFESWGRGRARGIELTLRQGQSNGSFWWASYAYARAERSWLHDTAPAPADGEQPHILNVAGSAGLPAGICLGFKLRVASGAPYTPDVFVRENHCFTGAHNSARYPLYHRLDLRIARTFRVGAGSLDAYLSVLNVLNARNVQQYYFDEAGNRQAIYMLPRLPVLGVEFRF